MIEWISLTSDEVKTLDRSLPVIIPLGLIEAHGHHLAVGLDNEAADYFSSRVAEASGAILAPTIYYGFADAMREYPGTIGVTVETLSLVIRDIAVMFCQQGFKKQIYLSGHGANQIACELGFHKVWERYPDLKPVYWNYWTEAGFTKIHHADKGETEIAMAIGSTVYMERARDYTFEKPWHLVNSRFQFQPESGGINGYPTTADPAEGERMRDEIVLRLSEKVRQAIRQ
ncbi:MAG: creatininase family protein [Anaerolineaceae bacterium]|nr:creatininase family protein [Anaerolineaceae bacterium]